MFKRTKILFMLLSTLLYTISAFGGSSTATLTSYIQDGTVINTSAAGVNITELVYSLGTPEDDLATWDGATAGGVAEDPLTDPRYFQTVRWSGLNVAPGNSFSFNGLDIDELRTVDPLVVTGGVTGGNALRNAFVLVTFSDGSLACSKLVEQAWGLQQNLVLTEGDVDSCSSNGIEEPYVAEPVPSLSTWSLMLLIGLMLSLGVYRRRYM